MSIMYKEHVTGRVDSGFSLIEVLVALLILSVGLLGLAGLQGRSLREGNDALRRTQAVQYAEDILDRMRANRANAGQYAIVLGAPVNGYDGIVETDLTEWKSGLANSLPGGDGSVALGGNLVTVIVVWLDGDPETNPDNTITVVTRL